LNRSDFQQLAELHLQHGKILLDASLYSGSWYISGYAVECGLKACIAKLFRLTADYEYPQAKNMGTRDGALNLFSHDVQFLVRIAGLKMDWENEIATDQVFGQNWNVVKTWTVESRYVSGRTRQEAYDFY
jgi:hypothetical protein